MIKGKDESIIKNKNIGSWIIHCLFLLSNLFLYFSGTISAESSLLVITATIFYAPFISFDLKNIKNWLSIILTLIIHILFAYNL